jgi:hypothetical protein
MRAKIEGTPIAFNHKNWAMQLAMGRVVATDKKWAIWPTLAAIRSR